MNDLEQAVKIKQDGAYLNLFVTPGANATLFPAGYNKWRKKIEIKVCSPAKDNQANIEVIKTVAKFFDKPVKDVFVISGGKNKEKTVLVKDASVSDIINRLQESLDEL